MNKGALRGQHSTQRPGRRGVPGANLANTGLPGSPRILDNVAGAAAASNISSSGARAVWHRFKAGHGYPVNAIYGECATTSGTETVSLAIARQPLPGEVTGAFPIIASTGQIPTPATGLVTISLDATVIIDVRLDWLGASASGATSAFRGIATTSSLTSSVPHKYGDYMGYQFVHPLVTGGTAPDGTTTGIRSQQFALIGRLA